MLYCGYEKDVRNWLGILLLKELQCWSIQPLSTYVKFSRKLPTICNITRHHSQAGRRARQMQKLTMSNTFRGESQMTRNCSPYFWKRDNKCIFPNFLHKITGRRNGHMTGSLVELVKLYLNDKERPPQHYTCKYRFTNQCYCSWRNFQHIVQRSNHNVQHFVWRNICG